MNLVDLSRSSRTSILVLNELQKVSHSSKLSLKVASLTSGSLPYFFLVTVLEFVKIVLIKFICSKSLTCQLLALLKLAYTSPCSTWVNSSVRSVLDCSITFMLCLSSSSRLV